LYYFIGYAVVCPWFFHCFLFLLSGQ
jgi:hypothetical protein